jgi:hypothetical protein
MGGNAIKCASPVNREELSQVNDTLRGCFFQKLGLFWYHDYCYVGSAFKKDPSTGIYSDFDFALVHTSIHEDAIAAAEIIVQTLRTFSPEIYLNRGFNVISFACPVGESGKFAQVDLMLTENMKLTEFLYHSPYPNESKYKGLHRNTALFAIASECKKYIISDNVWEQWMLSLKDGLIKCTRTNLSPKTGLVTKTNRILTAHIIASTPNSIMKSLLGFYNTDTIKTFERILEAVESPNFVHGIRRMDIIQKMISNFKNLGVELPTELEKYVTSE